ncbi:MAG: HAD hydrolase-like protein [Gemmiger sp.]|nr:HAD hydrolase-like protein [Gemmiger sp.]
MKTQLVLWDWNGTLLDDVEVCVDALNRLLALYHYPQQYDLAGYRAIFGFPIREYYLRAGFDFDKHSFETLAESYMSLYLPKSEGCGLCPGAAAALKALQQAGVRQTILSASQLPTLEAQVRQRGIRPYFSTLLGLGDIYATSKVALGRRFLETSGLDTQKTVMVGDSTHDFEVAQALGIPCLLYAGGHKPAETLRQTGAPVYSSLADVCGAIL